MKETINDRYTKIREEIHEIIKLNPIRYNRLEKGMKVRLWSGLENNSKNSFPGKEPVELRKYLFLLMPKMDHYIKNPSCSVEIEEINNNIITLKSGQKINYKFLELTNRIDPIKIE